MFGLYLPVWSQRDYKFGRKPFPLLRYIVMKKMRIHLPREPQFFKPILPGFEQQLTIPNGFMGYLKGEKGKEAILMSDNLVGRSWPVMIDGRSFGGDGWKEFVKDHELNIGNFLVFRHSGGMAFNVTVFDSTACQRDYLQDETPKRMRTGIQQRGDEKEAYPGRHFQIQDEDKEEEEEEEEEEKEEEEAPYFVVEMRVTNFKRGVLTIPIEFARSNALNNRRCLITLRNKKGESWQVNLRHKKSIPPVYITGGWTEFSEDNRLKIGDVCTFSLVSSGTKVVFEVAINDSIINTNETMEISDSTVSQRGYLQDGGKRKRTEGWEDTRRRRDLYSSSSTPPFRSVDQEEAAPYFTTKLNLITLAKNILTIPSKFARPNGLSHRRCEIVLRNKKGRSWQIYMTNDGVTHTAYLRRGWSEFSKDNRLRVGDVCMFKLLSSGKNLVMEVTISRSNGSQHLNDPARDIKGNVVGEAPCFSLTMKPLNLTRSTLIIPAKFGRDNGLVERVDKATLIDCKGIWWRVTMSYNKRNGQPYINGGWIMFADANSVKVGDVCTFKLISTGKQVVFEVTTSTLKKSRRK